MSPHLSIRPVLSEETALLAAISRSTFIAAFSADNTAANMESYLSNSLSETVLASEQHTSGAAFYFAELEGTIAGYLKINTGPAQKEDAGSNSMEIERIYILPEYWQQGIGQQLLDFVLQTAREAAITRIWLGVWEHNSRAIAFYRKNGFEAFGQHAFWLGDDRQTDILMQLSLG